MRNTSRVAGGTVVLAAVVIAACFGEAKLAGTQQAVIVPDRDPVLMGTAMVGSSIMTNPAITLSPQDQISDDTISSISKGCGSDFSIPAGVGAGARVFCSSGTGSALTFGGATYGSGACVPVSFAFNATFTPTGPGSASCGLTVNYAPTGGGSGSSRLITLNATGVAPTYALTVVPQPRFNFSDQILGVTSSPTTVTIKNTGATTMTVAGANSNPAEFAVSSIGGSVFGGQQLVPGQSVGYSVTCTPSAVGGRSATLAFSSPAGTHNVGLDCNGIGVSNLAITPVPAAFAPTLVGRPPTDVAVNITNNGTAATTLTVSLNASTPELSFAAGGDPNNAILGVGASTTARLQYTAATEHPSSSLGTLTVSYSGGSSRNITINGTALTGEVGWAPAAIDFGPVCVGATASKPVMVYASAAGNVDISSVTGALAPFGVSRTTGTLQGNHANTIDFMATVTPNAPGELMGSFTLNTNLPVDAAKAIPLTAVALPAGVTPTPNLVHFGPGRVGTTTAAKTIDLSNCGAAPINITAARIEGASAGDFTIVSPENPVMSLPQMGSVKFLVVMSPRQNGTKAAQLVIEHDGGTVTADLDGNGFAGDEDAVEQETYYTCGRGADVSSRSSSSALAPLGFALLLLRRRRRARCA